jgi:ABC-type amino acid transport substrate-binding protein
VTRLATALALVAALALPGAALADDTAPPASPAAPPTSLVVALGLDDPALQAGVLRGRDVILARGLEVEVARALARRLGGRVQRFVHVASRGRLLASGGADWQLAFAGIEASSRAPGVDLSAPYLTTDVVVVARRGLDRPRGLADLRRTLVCAVRGGDAAQEARSLRPKRSPLLLPSADRLLTALRTGACDAALVPAAEAGRFVAAHGRVLGPVVGRIRHGKGLVVAVARGGGLSVADVDRGLARLRRDGTLGRLARVWLGLDPAALPVLR